MTVLPRTFAVFALFAAALPFVAATGQSSCKSNEFWFGSKSCCLPNGQTKSPAPPPSNKACPNSHGNWYWSNDKNCCLPQVPPQAPPSCPSTHTWDSKNVCCNPQSPPPPNNNNPPPPPGNKPPPPPPGGNGPPPPPGGSKPPPPPGGSKPPPPPSGPGDCDSSDFWFGPKKCCLNPGKPQTPTTPPPNKSCPTSGGSWYWSGDKGCCLPHSPPPSSPPSCKGGHWWDHDNVCCSGGSPPPSNPTPSGKPHNNHKRTHKSRSTSQCPTGLTACPVSSLNSSDVECIDTTQELESCGGCATTGAGQDCTVIPGAGNVGCEAGVCAVYNCMTGFTLSLDKKSCFPL